MTVFTIGHSTHELEAFAGHSAGGRHPPTGGRAARSPVPGTIRSSTPWTRSGKALRNRSHQLQAEVKDLGGFRHGRVGSDDEPRVAERVVFRGYADYMQTAEFAIASAHRLLRSRRSREADRDHVRRGGCPVAMPSLADRRRAHCSRSCRRGYFQRNERQAPCPQPHGQGPRGSGDVPRYGVTDTLTIAVVQQQPRLRRRAGVVVRDEMEHVVAGDGELHVRRRVAVKGNVSRSTSVSIPGAVSRTSDTGPRYFDQAS